MAIPYLALTQYFAGSAWQVDVEVDLSLQQTAPRRRHSPPRPQWSNAVARCVGTPAAIHDCIDDKEIVLIEKIAVHLIESEEMVWSP